ncbi:MurR/RpiR family transcriptional regulator [Leucobacter sp.]
MLSNGNEKQRDDAGAPVVAEPGSPGAEGRGSILERISAILDRISRSERRVAEAILAEPQVFTGYTMARAAEVAGVSEPTVMRLARSLGCDGFQSLKMELTQALALGMPVTFSSITDADSVDGIARKVFDHTITSLDKARNELDIDALERAVDILEVAPCIIFIGFGASNVIATDAAQKFSVFGRPLLAPTDPHQIFMAISTLSAPSAVVAISNGGRTGDVIRLARAARQRGLPTIVMTGNPDAPLLEYADIGLVVPTFENTDLYTPAASRIAGLTVVDILAAAIAVRRGEEHREQFRAMKTALLKYRTE